jgi:hypothetical protein
MTTYRVVIEGGVLQGFVPDEVRRRLAALAGRSEEVAAKMLSGRPSTVKRGIDEATASRYVETLKKIGVSCRLEQEILELDVDAPQISASPPAVTAATSARPVSPPSRGTAFAGLNSAVPLRKQKPRHSKTFAWVSAVVVVVGLLGVMTLINQRSPADRATNTGTEATLTPEQQAQQERQRERDAQLEERKKQFAAQRSSLIARVKQLNASGNYADAFQLGSQWLALDPELDAQTDIAREKVAAQNERVEQARRKTSASHKRGICGEIAKLDLLLYDNPRVHEATTNCSYTDERLLITPKGALTDERMKRFVFLAFLTVGSLRNEDFMLPDSVYVGHGSDCQVMATNDAATLQRTVKFGGDSGMLRGMMSASSATRVACPK